MNEQVPQSIQTFFRRLAASEAGIYQRKIFAYILRASCTERFVCIEMNARSAAGSPKDFSKWHSKTTACST